MNDMKYTLVGIGEILWDLLPKGKQLGGAPANFAYHGHALGARGIVFSRVGQDGAGAEIIAALDSLGLDGQYISTDDIHPTGSVSVELDPSGEPNYIIHEDVAWDYLAESAALLDLASQIDAVCFGTLGQRSNVSRATIRKFLKATSPDCVRVFDINLRQSYFNKTIIEDMLALANVLKLNNNELSIVADVLQLGDSESEAIDKLIDRYNLRLVALTMGKGGSCLYAGSERSVCKGFNIEVVDTVGAGDAFTAALTLGLLRDSSLDAINEYANRVASFVCTQAGAMPAMPKDLALF